MLVCGFDRVGGVSPRSVTILFFFHSLVRHQRIKRMRTSETRTSAEPPITQKLTLCSRSIPGVWVVGGQARCCCMRSFLFPWGLHVPLFPLFCPYQMHSPIPLQTNVTHLLPTVPVASGCHQPLDAPCLDVWLNQKCSSPLGVVFTGVGSCQK